MIGTRLLRPRSVAFVGGSLAPEAMRICREGGFGGPIHAVHPTRPGAYRTIADLPEAPDAAYIAVNAHATIEAVRELAAIGAGGAACYAAGFAEAGEHELQAALLEAAGEMPILGPNCYGLINRVDGSSLWPIEFPLPRVERGVGLVLQSGNIGINISWADRSLPVAFLLSVGNQARIDVAAAVALLAAQPETAAIGIYLEGLPDAAAFSRAAADAAQRGIPLAVLRSGKSAAGARVTATHTAALAGSSLTYDALFDRLGIAACETVPALLETLKALAAIGPLRGRRAAVITCSGGESALAADAAERAGIVLDPPTAAARAAIAAELPPYAAVGNPLDYTPGLWGLADPLRRIFRSSITAEIDVSVLVLDHLATAVDDEGVDAATAALIEAAAAVGSPAAIVSTVPENGPPARRLGLLRAHGVVPLQGIGEALAALGACAAFGEAVRRGITAPTAVPLGLSAGRLLDEHAAKAMIAAAGVRIPRGLLVAPAAAAGAAGSLGGRVVVKLCSPDLPHKAERGAVAVGLRGPAEVAAAVERMIAVNRDLPLAGVLVEEMIDGVVAEVLVGIVHDPVVGPAVIVGSGGSLTEELADACALLPPFTPDQVETALRSLRIARRILRGDLAAAVVAVCAIGTLIPNVVELDVNPLLILENGCVAADAVIRLGTVESP